MLAFLYCYFSCFLSFFLPLFFYPFLFIPWLVFPFIFPFLFSFMSLPVSIFLFLIPFFLFFFPPFPFFLFSHHCGFSKWCTVFGQVETMSSVVEALEGSSASWHESGSTAGGQGPVQCCRWAACLKSPCLRALLPGLGRDNDFFGRDHDCEPESMLEHCRSNFPYPEPICSNIHKFSG